VGNPCPFPALKAVFDPELRPKGVFPLRSAERSAELVAGSRRSLLALDGSPTLPQTSLRDMSVRKTEETPVYLLLDTGISFFYIRCTFLCKGSI
jgi:hypothetical protein